MQWGKYGGRLLSDVYLDDKLYSKMIIDEGLARPYDGKTKKAGAEEKYLKKLEITQAPYKEIFREVLPF